MLHKQSSRPFRFPLLAMLVAISLVQGCADYVKEAEEAVGDTLANRHDAEYQKMQTYPGKVVCGEVAETDRWGPTLEFRRFIVRDGHVINRPSSNDWTIYCSNNPRQRLEDLLQSGPIDDNAELQKIVADMLMLQQALQEYLLDAKNLPTTEQGLEALITRVEGVDGPIRFREGGYLEVIPSDPWGRPYVYWRSPLAGAVAPRYKLYTLGKDGKKGGTGPDADVTKRELQYLVHVIKL